MTTNKFFNQATINTAKENFAELWDEVKDFMDEVKDDCNQMKERHQERMRVFRARVRAIEVRIDRALTVAMRRFILGTRISALWLIGYSVGHECELWNEVFLKLINVYKGIGELTIAGKAHAILSFGRLESVLAIITEGFFAAFKNMFENDTYSCFYIGSFVAVLIVEYFRNRPTNYTRRNRNTTEESNDVHLVR